MPDTEVLSISSNKAMAFEHAAAGGDLSAPCPVQRTR